MKTLKKLSEEHYIIYDDSVNIEENCFCFKNGKIIEISFLAQDNGNRITHSFGKELDGVENRPLYEVEELLFGYSLDSKIREHLESSHIEASLNRVRVIKNLIQELNKDKLFTIEDMRKAFQAGSDWQEGGTIIYPNEHRFIQSIQPTHCKVKFNEQGKLELT